MVKSTDKELGESFSSAYHRLVKDLLYDFVSKSGIKCHQCGGEMTREDFSIEHKTPWKGSDDPKDLFFNIENISYSHRVCNTRAKRPQKRKDCPSLMQYKRGCRCDPCKELQRESWKKYVKKKPYDPKERKARYIKYGS